MRLFLRMAIVIIFLPWSGAAQANSSQRVAGSYVCLNNPTPECRNPERQVTPAFACINNPNPECHHSPRPRTELEPKTWSCQMNQNVTCNNTIRYSVENREIWENNFEGYLSPTKR